jgi:mono/diheme cytochrome c family protein
MKHITLPILLCLYLTACNTKKASTSSVSTEPTEVQLIAAQTKFPQANMEDLKKGHDIYYSSCSSCHKAKTITKETAEEWPGILDNMAKKAKISDEQKDAVYKYITGVLVSAKK